MEKTIILSLGGSLIAPDGIDTVFLKNFKNTVEKHVKKGYRFVIICGGGNPARIYQEELRKLIGNDQKALDWIGISATWMNAMLVNMLFGKNSYPDLVTNPTKKIKTPKKIITAAGWKPGHSTDYDAVLLAQNLGADAVINMSNIDFVYTKDPRKHTSAKKITNICWRHYRQLISKKWKAGLNAPFDPVAAKAAEKRKLTVIIIGRNLKNFEKVLQHKRFKGTIISFC